MTTIELRKILTEYESRYPKRELAVIAREDKLLILVAMGALPPPELRNPDLGYGTASRWEEISIPDPNADESLERRIAKILGPDREMFDFGNGINTMPIPDPGGDGWLTKSMCFAYSKMPPVKILGAEIVPPLFRVNRSELEGMILEAVNRIVNEWDEHAIPFEIGDPLPIRRLV